MKNFLVITWMAFMLAACSGGYDAEKLKSFPSYKQVYEQAFTSNSVYFENKWFLKLARKPDGWYLVKNDMNTSKQLETYLYWSASEKTYKPFPDGWSSPNGYKTPADRNEARMFSVIPFYGYEKWYDDVIANFEDADLTDTLMEGLARAYSTRASQEGGLTYGADGKMVKKLSAGQQEAFIRNMDRALEIFQELYKKYPAYNTLIGNGHTKYSNECLNVYTSLKYFGEGEKAKKYLRDGLYTPFVLNTSKNMLATCGQNAILVTYGDNDYYPLIYVQDKLGFRKDVAVLNISLMQVDNYIEKFIEQFHLKTEMSAKGYGNPDLAVILLSEGNDTVYVSEILRDFEAGRMDKYMRPVPDGKSYPALNGRILSFNSMTKQLRMEMPKSYIYKNDLFLWDLIYSNGPERPICLSSQGSWGPYLPYLRETAMVYTVVNDQPEKTDKMTAMLDTAATEKLLLQTYKYDWTGQQTDWAAESLAGAYLYQFYHLANAYAGAGKKEHALQVIDGALKIFPQKTLPFNFTYCALARVVQECGDEDQAAGMVMAFLNDLETRIKTAKGEKLNDLLQNLQSISAMFGYSSGKWTAVTRKAQELLKQYNRVPGEFNAL